MPPEIGHSHKSQYTFCICQATQFYIEGNHRWMLQLLRWEGLSEKMGTSTQFTSVHNLFLQVLCWQFVPYTSQGTTCVSMGVG